MTPTDEAGRSGIPTWDALVVGGGPAGSAATLALARAGRRVALVERRTRVGWKLGESIPPQARTLVDHLLGPCENEAAERREGRFRTYGNASSWGSDAEQVQDFVFTPHGYGLRLDRPRFDRALRRQARDEGVEVLLGAGVSSVEPLAAELDGDAVWSVRIGDAFHPTRFLVDCTGRSARISQQLGARRLASDRLFAFAQIYALDTECAPDPDTLTRIESAPDGWWYTARLPEASQDGAGGREGEGRRLVVFHTDRDLPAARRAATADGFEALLDDTRRLGERFRRLGYRPLGRPRGAPAGSERLDRFHGPGWMAAGDAAQSFDPLSSRGIGTALRSGLAAGAAVDACLRGDPGALPRYSQEQEAIHAEYLRQHRYFYGCEPRWPGHPFWNRRQGDASAADALTASPRLEKPLEKETPCAS